ncbi:NYN domain-containing protein [Chloroflexota bacterium]
MPTRYNNYAYIDGVNLHRTYASPDLDWEVDYNKLLNYLRKRYEVGVAYYFLGNVPNNKDIQEKLDLYGYTLKLKEPSPYTEDAVLCSNCGKTVKPQVERHKADVDSYLTMQVMSDMGEFNKAIIITSDGDYDELVKRLVRQDRLKAVFAPCKKGCSWLLKSAARGRIVFMDDYRDELEKI